MRPILGLVLLAASVQAQPDFRPVVLEGERVPRLLGTVPDEIAAFAVQGGALVPVPIQIDERFVYDLARAYPPSLEPRDCPRRAWCRDLRGQVVEVGYADAGTYVGADPDPSFDALDELALLVADFGAATDRDPGGVVAATRTVVEVEAEGETRYAYLYRRIAPTPESETSGVRYAVAFERGDYRTTYDHGGRMPPILGFPYGHPSGDRVGSNPEDSRVTTSYYHLRFADRWLLTELAVGDGPDLLDVDMIGFGPGICWRTPYTGSLSEGAFVVNRSGPVRAIRGVVGFNSGPLVQQTWVFYPRLIETRAALRVHSVPGVMSYLDLSADAVGMTYSDATYSDGVRIEGGPDRLRPSVPSWQAVTGTQGTLVTYHQVTAEGFEPTVETYYEDHDFPSYAACVGDDEFVGAHGLRIDQEIPNTDPRNASDEGLARLSLTRRIVVGGEVGATVGRLEAPLTITVR